MSTISNNIQKITDSFNNQRKSIEKEIYILNKQLESIQDKEYEQIKELGKIIDLSEIDMHYQHYKYFPYLVEGYILENGINSSHINDYYLNLIVNGINISENKELLAEKIKKSFFKLSEKEQFIFATFIPKHFEYKNIYMGSFPLIHSKQFKWLIEYFIEKYSLILVGGIHSYKRDVFDKMAEKTIFSATQRELIIDEDKPYCGDNARKHTFINLNNKALKEPEKTKKTIQLFKDLGYQFDFEPHPYFGNKIDFKKLDKLFGFELLNIKK